MRDLELRQEQINAEVTEKKQQIMKSWHLLGSPLLVVSRNIKGYEAQGTRGTE